MSTTISVSYNCLSLDVASVTSLFGQARVNIERIIPNKALIQSALPITQEFNQLSIIPGLFGKWYTCSRTSVQPPNEPSLQSEEDDGSWYHCKERKGGDMVACD